MLAARVEPKNGTYLHNIQTDHQSSPRRTGVAMFGINCDRRSQTKKKSPKADAAQPAA
jgi:hypothetical protein